MKILFYASGARFHEDLGLLLDEAICLNNEGHDVFFVYNNCSLGICTMNMSKASHLCEVCKRCMTNALKNLPSQIKRINLSEFWDDSTIDVNFNYNSIADIKKIEYKHVKIGYSVLSSYFTMTRNLCPKIDNTFKSYINDLLTTSCQLTDALERAIEVISPDRFCFFNSRFFEWRPAYDLSISQGLEAISYERTVDEKTKNCKLRYINTTPHNIQNKQKCCSATWESILMDKDKKYAIGKDFFEKRRNGIATNDKVYISNQQIGKLPLDWSAKKRNFVIFNSSEDEFASIGDEYDSKALFPSQYQGIRFILDSLREEKDVQVYLRIHPNLASVPFRYHTELQKLQKQYANLSVIKATDSISTYAMMDAAEKVIVFGSTMGLEAAYWGKAVILLAGAFYYESNLCYVPKTTNELKELLSCQLKPKDNFEAIKWGFYLMYRNSEDRYKYIDWDADWFNIGKFRFLDIHYLKLLGSSKLYAIYIKFLTRYYRKHATKLEIPIEEDIGAVL